VRPAGLFWAAREAAVIVLVAALASCATVERHVTVWQVDDPGGVYPAGPMSGDPAYFVGWRLFR